MEKLVEINGKRLPRMNIAQEKMYTKTIVKRQDSELERREQRG